MFVARARAPSKRSKTPPKMTSSPRGSSACGGRGERGDDAIPKPMQRSGRWASGRAARRRARSGSQRADAGAELRADERAAHEAARSRLAAAATRGCPPGGRRRRRMPRGEPAERLAADPAGRHEAGGAEPADVPRDERLGQPDLGDELGDRRLADGEARTIRRRLTSASALWTNAAREGLRAGGRRWRGCSGRGRGRDSGDASGGLRPLDQRRFISMEVDPNDRSPGVSTSEARLQPDDRPSTMTIRHSPAPSRIALIAV